MKYSNSELYIIQKKRPDLIRKPDPSTNTAIIALFVDGSGLRIKSGLFLWIRYNSFSEYFIKKRGSSFVSNLDQLSTNTNLNNREKENPPSTEFLNMGACKRERDNNLEVIVKV